MTLDKQIIDKTGNQLVTYFPMLMFDRNTYCITLESLLKFDLFVNK